MGRNAEPRGLGVGFLLSQLGAHSAGRFAARCAPLDVSPPHVGLLRSIAVTPGRSQQALAEEFRIPASRIVVLLDDLEEKGLVERRSDPADRRVHLVHLTAAGEQLLDDALRAGTEAERELLAALSASQRRLLSELLVRVADQQGLTRGVHPGYRSL